MNFFKLFIVLIFFIFNIILNAQEKYEYPLNQNMPEWKTLSVEKKNKMLQIPENKIKNISTRQLIQAYIENPFTSFLFAYDNIQDGYFRVYKEFNGLRELMERKDCAIELYKYYKSIKVDGYDVKWKPAKKGKFTFEFIYIEVLLGQPEILLQLSEKQTNDLMKELIKKYDEKTKHHKLHSLVGLSYCANTMAKILRKNYNLFSSNDIKDSELEYFLRTSKISNTSLLDLILSKAITSLQN